MAIVSVKSLKKKEWHVLFKDLDDNCTVVKTRYCVSPAGNAALKSDTTMNGGQRCRCIWRVSFTNQTREQELSFDVSMFNCFVE